MIPFLAIYLAVERGFPLWFVGSVYAVSGISALISGLVGGRLTDFLGPKKVMILAYSMASIFSLAMWQLVVIGGDQFSFLLAYPLFSFARGLSQPSSSAVVANISTAGAIGGFSVLLVAGNLGFTVGPALGGVLIEASGYQSVFFLSTAASFASLVFTAVLVKGGKLLASKDESERGKSGGVRRWPGWPKDRNLIFFLVLVFCLSLTVGYQNTPFSLYSSDFLHIPDGQVGFLYAINGLVIVIFQLPVMRVVSRSGRNLVFPLAISSFVTMVGLFIAAFASQFIEMAIVMALITFGEILLSAPSQHAVNLFSYWGNRGTYQGLYSAFFEGGIAAAIVLGPLSLELASADPGIAWEVAGVFSLATGIAFIALSPGLQRDYQNSTGSETRP